MAVAHELELSGRITTVDGEALTAARVVVGAYGEPVLVLNHEKKVDSYPAYKVIKALVDAGPRGLSLPELKNVSENATRILNNLSRDDDWKAVIHMAREKGKGYRIG